MPEISGAAGSSIHSKDIAKDGSTNETKHDVENIAGLDDEKESEALKDPNIVDWDGPDDVGIHSVPHGILFISVYVLITYSPKTP